jgi:myo-inositol-1(or 4)-monophosphatase
MPTDLYKVSRAAEQAAYAAGAHLQASRSRLPAGLVTQESPEAITQTIDAQARALIREVVLRHFPGHAILGDELDTQGRARIDDRPHWVVTALDGAANYQRGYPQYAVCVALLEGGEPQLGAVYDPSRNEFFGAIRGRGAVLNGEALRCATARPPVQALIATVFPPPQCPRMAAYLGEFGRVVPAVGGVRRSGSIALELAYLAAGRIDGFWAHSVAPWELAAGLVLLREAGAQVHARDGRPLLASESLAACAPAMGEPFLRLLLGA